MLDIISSTDENSGYWPSIFSSIPIIESSTPPREWFGDSSACQPYTYLLGIASFLDLDGLIGKCTEDAKGSTNNKISPSSYNVSSSKKTSPNPSTSSSLGPTKYHPYVSLRLRGIVHPVPAHMPPTSAYTSYDQGETGGIPGFQRIVMIMYKPTTRYLIQVLERSMEEYGDPFLQLVPAVVQIQQQHSFTPVATGGVSASGEGEGSIAASSQLQAAQPPQPTLSTTTAQPSPAEMEAALKSILEQRVHDFETRYRGRRDLMDDRTTRSRRVEPDHTSGRGEKEEQEEIWTHHLIARLESSHIPPGHLVWDDIEYAYAYEGLVTPGCRVMMGRWWRCATVGGGGDGGPAMEVVELPGVEGGGWARERGPFCFWC